jgi:DNA polymerase-3 subunit gamma/tau
LNYLQQAIQLVAEEGMISKKKVTDQAKIVSFRNLPLTKMKEMNLLPSSPEKQTEPVAASLVIESPDPIIKKQVLESVKPADEPNKNSGRIGSLQKIRERVIQKKDEGKKSKPLDIETLQIAWNDFIETLLGKKNHSAVTNFKMAELQVEDEHSFNILTSSNMHYKFIEAERSDLIHFMQQYFDNRSLKYQLLLVESDSPSESRERSLTLKEKYQLLTEEFPLIKELKDRLKLELD